MQVAVQPQIGKGQQFIQHVAKAGRARHQAVARVGAAQAGREMRDGHRGAIEGPGQRLAQPLLADQRLLAHGLGQEGLAVARAAGLLQVEIGGAKGLLAQLEQPGQIGHAFMHGHGVVVAPQRGAHEAHAAQHGGLALQPDHAHALAGGAQAGMGGVEVLHVVLMVARHEDHGAGPARVLGQGRETLQPEVLALQQAAALVGAYVAGQHQHVGIGCGLGDEMRMGLEVQVGQQLDLHAAKCRTCAGAGAPQTALRCAGRSPLPSA